MVEDEQLGRRSAARLHLEVEIAERLTAGVAHAEAGGLFFDAPGRREATALGLWHSLSRRLFHIERSKCLEENPARHDRS